jgi:REM2 and Rab-like small GTPase 1
MTLLDFEWLKSNVGKEILQSVKDEGRLKAFGLLEKPTLASPNNHYEEVPYKIVIIGKEFSGKTSFLNSLCKSRFNSALLTDEDGSNKYKETPGIHVTHLYWPVKVTRHDRVLMFNLAMWDVGKTFSTKYDYILPVI